MDIDPVTGEEYPPQILADHRWVYGGYADPAEPRYRALVQELKKAPKAFHDRLAMLERDWLAYQTKKGKQGASAPGSESGGDEGTEAALAVLDRVLRELTEGGGG